MPPENDVDKFFAGLPTKSQQPADIFGDLTPKEAVETPEKGAEASEEDPEKGIPEGAPRNRQERRARAARWEERLSEKEKDLIAREARIGAIEDLTKGDAPTIDERLIRLYGPENLEASKLTQSILDDAVSKAEERAYARIKADREREAEDARRISEYLDDQFEAVEDQFGVDLTSDSPAARKARNGLIDLVEKLSPKDDAGEITDYVDFTAAYEIYKANAEKPAETPSRAKEIAARTMQKSGTAPTPPKVPTAGFYGWQKDYGNR